MRRIWRLLEEYALVIVVMFVAGIITGACTVQETPQPVRRSAPVLNCEDSHIIRFMPNWIRNWNPSPLDRQV